MISEAFVSEALISEALHLGSFVFGSLAFETFPFNLSLSDVSVFCLANQSLSLAFAALCARAFVLGWLLKQRPAVIYHVVIDNSNRANEHIILVHRY